MDAMFNVFGFGMSTPEEKYKFFEQQKEKNIAAQKEKRGIFWANRDMNKPKRIRAKSDLDIMDSPEGTGYIDDSPEGKGKRIGTLGKFVMQDDDGNQFGCPPGKGHNYKDLADMLANIHEYMGQRATFTYFERTKAGSYRHPLYKCIRNYE